MAKGLRKNDPYKNMGSGKEGIRPGFLGGSGDGDKKADDSGLTPKESASKDAADNFGAAEDAATEEGLSSQL